MRYLYCDDASRVFAVILLIKQIPCLLRNQIGPLQQGSAPITMLVRLSPPLINSTSIRIESFEYATRLSFSQYLFAPSTVDGEDWHMAQRASLSLSVLMKCVESKYKFLNGKRVSLYSRMRQTLEGQSSVGEEQDYVFIKLSQKFVLAKGSASGYWRQMTIPDCSIIRHMAYMLHQCSRSPFLIPNPLSVIAIASKQLLHIVLIYKGERFEEKEKIQPLTAGDVTMLHSKSTKENAALYWWNWIIGWLTW